MLYHSVVMMNIDPVRGVWNFRGDFLGNKDNQGYKPTWTGTSQLGRVLEVSCYTQNFLHLDWHILGFSSFDNINLMSKSDWHQPSLVIMHHNMSVCPKWHHPSMSMSDLTLPLWPSRWLEVWEHILTYSVIWKATDMNNVDPCITWFWYYLPPQKKNKARKITVSYPPWKYSTSKWAFPNGNNRLPTISHPFSGVNSLLVSEIVCKFLFWRPSERLIVPNLWI